MKKYDIIYADPPWEYGDKMKGHSFSLDHEYITQNKDWIKNLPVQKISNKDCCLFLWVTSPLLDEGIDVIKAWGFNYKTIGFVWSKYSSNGNLIHNLGRWTMGNIELCLLGIKGNPNKWRKDKSIKQLVRAKRCNHSAKPDEVRERIIQLLGDRPRIELFARGDRTKNIFGNNKFDGWDLWGNEVESDIKLIWKEKLKEKS